MIVADDPKDDRVPFGEDDTIASGTKARVTHQFKKGYQKVQVT